MAFTVESPPAQVILILILKLVQRVVDMFDTDKIVSEG